MKRISLITTALLTAGLASFALTPLPWTDDFSSSPISRGYTVIDANGDSKAWTWVEADKYMRIAYNESADMDDWLITPALNLKAGQSYKFALDAKCGWGAEKLEVKVGTSPTPGAMTIEAIAPTEIVKTTFTTVQGEFTATADGNHYIGIHGISPAGRLFLYVDNLRLIEGEGEIVAGPAQPLPVPSLQVGELSEGEVTLRWTAPTADIDGKPLTPDQLTYKVVRYEMLPGSLFYEEDVEGGDNLTATEFVFRELPAGADQKFTAYGVYAVTEGGKSTPAKTPLFPIGHPYEGGYSETFLRGEASNLYRSEVVGYYEVSPDFLPVPDGTASITSRADMGFLAMMGLSENDCARFYTGKISLAGMENPQLGLHVYNPTTDPAVANNNEVEIYVSTGAQFQLEKIFTVSSLPAAGWCHLSIPLEHYKDQTIQICIQNTVVNYMVTAFDILRVRETPDYPDLEIVSLSLPEQVNMGTDFLVNIDLGNVGMPYTGTPEIEIHYDDMNKVETISPAVTLGTDEKVTISHPMRFDPFHNDGPSTFWAYVRCPRDEYQFDNRSNDVSMQINESPYSAPVSFTGQQTDQGILLSWEAPATAGVNLTPLTESFADATPFDQHQACGFTLLDNDGALPGKLTGYVFPGIHDVDPEDVSPVGFFVLDYTLDGLNEKFAPRTGTKMLAQIYNVDDSRCDDWAISPLLNGLEQTVTLYARSYSSFPAFAESFELMTSHSGKATEDFTTLRTVTNVPSDWTQYTFTLPVGTTYFAIRCISEGCYMLFIDDITYTPAEGDSPATPSGYNIYRNQRLLNDTPVTAMQYLDSQVPDGDHRYNVTALYGDNEGRPSDAFLASLSGLVEIAGGTLPDTLRITDGGITVTGRYSVCDLTGRILASGTTAAPRFVALPAGHYIVTVDKKAHKVTLH